MLESAFVAAVTAIPASTGQQQAESRHRRLVAASDGRALPALRCFPSLAPLQGDKLVKPNKKQQAEREAMRWARRTLSKQAMAALKAKAKAGEIRPVEMLRQTAVVAVVRALDRLEGKRAA